MRQEKLIQVRKCKGLSQFKMAQIVAMEQTTYSRKEIGKSPIKDDEWKKFAEALEVTIEDIQESQSIPKKENVNFIENQMLAKYFENSQKIIDTIIIYNTKLKQENEALQIENLKLKLLLQNSKKF